MKVLQYFFALVTTLFCAIALNARTVTFYAHEKIRIGIKTHKIDSFSGAYYWEKTCFPDGKVNFNFKGQKVDLHSGSEIHVCLWCSNRAVLSETISLDNINAIFEIVSEDDNYFIVPREEIISDQVEEEERLAIGESSSPSSQQNPWFTFKNATGELLKINYQFGSSLRIHDVILGKGEHSLKINQPEKASSLTIKFYKKHYFRGQERSKHGGKKWEWKYMFKKTITYSDLTQEIKFYKEYNRIKIETQEYH